MPTDETSTSRTWRALRNAAARWAAPFSRSPGRALDAAEDRHRRHEILEIWRDTVRETGLSHRIYARSGTYRVEPRITLVAVSSGEPRVERFTIALGSDQTVADIVGVAAQIAAAFNVPRFGLRELPGRRLEIALRPVLPPGSPGLMVVPEDDAA